MLSRSWLVLLVLGFMLTLPLSAVAQDYNDLYRSGTGSGTGSGSGTGNGNTYGGTGTGSGDPVPWDGPRWNQYSPEMYMMFQEMLEQYRAYQSAPSYSTSEARAKARYDDARAAVTSLRLRGHTMFPHQTPALKAALRAYSDYQQAYNGSVNEKVAKMRYDEYMKDVELLGQTTEYSIPMDEAYDRYVDHYRQYLAAYSGSSTEAYHKRAAEYYKAQIDRQWGWGHTHSGSIIDAEREYLRWQRAYQSAYSGSAEERLARLRAEMYLRELEMMRGSGTGNGNFGSGSTGYGSGGYRGGDTGTGTSGYGSGNTGTGTSGYGTGSTGSGNTGRTTGRTSTGSGTSNRTGTGTGSGSDFGRPARGGTGSGSGSGTGSGTGSGY